jgi:hypothetical protein
VIARLSRILHIDPERLVALDPPLFLALEHEALRPEWTTMHELAANQVELLAGIVQMLAGLVGGFKPLRLPRPGDGDAAPDDHPNRVVIRPSQMAAALGARKRGVS